MTLTLNPTVTLTFTNLLQNAGIDPKDVKLMRHGESGHEKAPFFLWIASLDSEDTRFNNYQSLQTDRHAINRRYIASFVVNSLKETVFTGIFENHGSLGRAPQGTLCPVSGKDASIDHDLYDLRLTPYLENYVGRLTINWGKGHLAWMQNADSPDASPKEITAIYPNRVTAEFPGFDAFTCVHHDLEQLPNSWKEVLRHSQGVYLLTCLETGKRYVGSAYGIDGFYGRFLNYSQSGHGGNKRLLTHATTGYQMSVLEVTSSSSSLDDIIARENSWKERLLSRNAIFGLNDN